MRVRRGALAAVPAIPPDQQVDGPLVQAVVAELTAIGRLDTIDGQLALIMARRFESSEGTAAALGSLSRELTRSMAAARQGTTSREPDFLDEINARRLAKATKATQERPKL